MEDFRRYLCAGADKVSINTWAIESPEAVKEVANCFGKANVVVSIDVKREASGELRVYSDRGSIPTRLHPVDWARQMAAYGAGEVLITSIDREGTMEGYDVDLVRQGAAAVTVPVIANGGVGTLEHLSEGILEASASAVAASSIFHFTDQSPIKAQFYLKQAGLDVRIS